MFQPAGAWPSPAPRSALAFNSHGLGFSLNWVGPGSCDASGLGRNFVSRQLLTAQGHNYQLLDFLQHRISNFEVAHDQAETRALGDVAGIWSEAMPCKLHWLQLVAARTWPSMEVQVTDTFGLDEDVLVSIRYGTVRRQAPLESVKSHPFKFPAQLDDLSEPLKIDLLKPVASTRLVLHPKEEHYSIGFEQEDSIAMGLHVMAGSLEAETNSGGGKEAGAKDSASSAKDYLEQCPALCFRPV
eukprot:Skav201916  [mRNA]  locus=scaffold3992:180405:188179:+ [translate_table: standard]